MAKHKIAVISDTHDMVRPELIEVLDSADVILHGGDITNQKTLDQISELGEVIAVRGNCDRELSEDLPEERFLNLYGKKIYIIHNKKHISDLAEQADIIIYGHSHKYELIEEEGKLWLNPGSAGPRRFGRPVSMAVLEIDTETGEVEVDKIDPLDKGNKDKAKAYLEKPSSDPFKVARIVYEDLRKKKTAQQIIKKYDFNPDLVNQICQIYFTHPGIDLDGLLNRLEIAGL